MEISTELQLIEQAKQDIHAFKELYDYYFPKIFAYCYNRIGNREDTEDIACEVFVAAVEQIQKFDTSKKKRFGSWAYQVAHNKIVDYYKKSKKEATVELEENKETDSHDLDKEVQTQEIQTRIKLVLSKLKPRYQLIISLKFYEELEPTEIADIMEIKPSRVALIQHRALKSFKNKWSKFYPKSEISNYF